jgi:hypothetical protein
MNQPRQEARNGEQSMPAGRPPSRKFTRKENAQIEAMRAAGISLKQIARAMSLTIWVVTDQARRIGSYAAPLIEARYLRHVQRPHRVVDLVQKLGVTAQTICRAKRELQRRGYPIYYCSSSLKRR